MANEEKKMEGIQQNGGSNDKITKIVDELSKLTIAEAIELSRALKELGFEPQVQQASVQAAAPTPAQTPAEETKESFNLILRDVGDSKLTVMKLARNLFNLGLPQVKELFETPGSTLATNVSKKDADSYIQQFTAVGATVVAE